MSTNPRARLLDRLIAARKFVGRSPALALFAAALAADPPPFAVLYIYGPGGIGKSSLLQHYAQSAAAAGRALALLDSRNLDPSPQGLLQALALAFELEQAELTLESLASIARPVILLDTYEILSPLDSWLREYFLPQLAYGALVVIAGRTPPSAAWRSDATWHALMSVISLRNLRPEESEEYLRQRGIPDARHAKVVQYTHGHPLALSLLADLAAQSRERALDLSQSPDIVALLLERFIQDLPSPLHRLALHSCAIVRSLNESLLRDALKEPDVQTIFAWLRGLSFIEQGPNGLFPHDLARDVLDNDLRWRDPDGYRELYNRVRHTIVQSIMSGKSQEQLQAVFDLVYLHRHSPILQTYYAWKSFGSLYPKLALAFLRVLNLMATPASILRPKIAVRVLWGNLRQDRAAARKDKHIPAMLREGYARLRNS